MLGKLVRVVEGDAQATAPKAPEPPFWALYEVDHGYLMPFVAIGADMASAVLVQDPAFTYLGLTPGFLTITKFSKTPCGPVKTVRTRHPFFAVLAVLFQFSFVCLNCYGLV